MDPVDPNAARFDPNEPDCTNGDFFCRLCLSSQNSDTMWAQHIAGKRHIKNAQKFPNGLPTRDRDMHDEDSYERPPKRERFDDGYDLHDDYPMPMYKDDYYGDDPYLKRPLVDYTPAVKPSVVIDYGHSKKLEEAFPPALIDKSSVVPPPISSVSRPLPASSPVDFNAVLEQLLPNSTIDKSEVKDDFFEKINQREMAKELARKLSNKSMELDNLKPVFSSTEKKDFANKTSSARDDQDKYDKREPDILDVIYETSEKKSKLNKGRNFRKRSSSSESDEKSRSREKDFEKKSSSRENNEKRRSRERDSGRRRSRDRDSGKRRSRSRGRDSGRRRSRSRSRDSGRRRSRERDSDKKSSSYKNNDKKKSRLDDERDSEKKISSFKNNEKKRTRLDDEKDTEKKTSLSKTSSAKFKSELDDLDPDELTPDMLDTLLSAHLPKKTDSSEEICNKKHCVKNLDDPKIIAEKLESLPTMEFLNIIHKKLISIDLKTPEELKKLLAVIAEAQATVCKKLPPELQELVKAKLSGNDAQPPAQNPAVSRTQSITPSAISSNMISKNSIPSVTSLLQAAVSAAVSVQNPVFSQTQSITPSAISSNVISKNSIPSVTSLLQAAVSVQNPVFSQSQSITPSAISSNVASKNSIPSVTSLLKAAVSVQNPVFSQSQPITPSAVSSNVASKNSIASVSSLLQAAVSVNPVPKPVVLPTPSIPVSLNQGSVSTISTAVRPQNQIPVSNPSSVAATIPTMASLRMTAPPPPPPPLINAASINRASSMGTNSVQNYYDMIFSMCRNRSVAPHMFANQQLSAASTSLPPPPPPPIPQSLQARPPTVTKEILDAVAKLNNQSTQSKTESSVSDKSKPQTREEILAALRNLDVLQEEYKRRKAQKAASENRSSTSEKSKSSPYNRR